MAGKCGLLGYAREVYIDLGESLVPENLEIYVPTSALSPRFKPRRSPILILRGPFLLSSNISCNSYPPCARYISCMSWRAPTRLWSSSASSHVSTNVPHIVIVPLRQCSPKVIRGTLSAVEGDAVGVCTCAVSTGIPGDLTFGRSTQVECTIRNWTEPWLGARLISSCPRLRKFAWYYHPPGKSCRSSLAHRPPYAACILRI